MKTTKCFEIDIFRIEKDTCNPRINRSGLLITIAILPIISVPIAIKDDIREKEFSFGNE
jgi:hypothetical protein